MKFSIVAEKFRDGVGRVLDITSKKTGRTSFQQALIKVEKDGLEILATDLEVSAKIKLEATVEENGSFVARPKYLYNILRELPLDKEVEFYGEGSTPPLLKINCSKTRFDLQLSDVEEFPTLLFNDEEPHLKVESKKLLEAIEKTFYAISHDDKTQTYFTGLFFQKEEDKLRTVGCDGNRLATFDFDIQWLKEAPSSIVNGIIIPRRGVYELRRMAEHCPDDEISLRVDDSFIHANVASIYHLSIFLIAQDYPLYKKIIPEQTVFTLKTEQGLFLDAVKRIKLMSDSESDGIKLSLKEREMALNASNPTIGTADEKIGVEYDGKEMEFNFKASYLLEALGHFGQGPITVELNNPYRAILLKNPSSPDGMGLIMPRE